MLAPLPYLTFWILCLILSLFSDMSINKKIFTIGVSRKIFSSIGLYTLLHINISFTSEVRLQNLCLEIKLITTLLRVILPVFSP